eukprot:s2837_g12.t1
MAAVQYRWCLATFELYGGIPKQTTLVGLMGSESSEVSVAWAVVLLFAVSLLEGAMAAALLAGPLRRPDRPIGLDIFDTCMDVQLEQRKGKEEVELSAMKTSQGAASSAGAPCTKAAPPRTATHAANDGPTSCARRSDAPAQSFAARLAPRHYPFGLPTAVSWLPGASSAELGQHHHAHEQLRQPQAGDQLPNGRSRLCGSGEHPAKDAGSGKAAEALEGFL